MPLGPKREEKEEEHVSIFPLMPFEDRQRKEKVNLGIPEKRSRCARTHARARAHDKAHDKAEPGRDNEKNMRRLEAFNFLYHVHKELKQHMT